MARVPLLAVALAAAAAAEEDLFPEDLARPPRALGLRERRGLFPEKADARTWKPWRLYGRQPPAAPGKSAAMGELAKVSNIDDARPVYGKELAYGAKVYREMGVDAMKHACLQEDGDRWLHNVTEPKLVPFLAPRGAGQRSQVSVVVIPGGECSVLPYDKEGVRIAQWLNSLNISAFVLKYRVPCTVHHKEDAERAIRMVRTFGGNFGLNASRVGVLAFGWGATAATYLYQPQVTFNMAKRRPDHIDEAARAPDFQMLVYPRFSDSYELAAGEAPPTFLAQAADDECGDPVLTISYSLAVKNMQRIHPEIHIYGQGKSGFGDCSYPEYVNFEACAWKERARRFLERRVLGARAA